MIRENKPYLLFGEKMFTEPVSPFGSCGEVNRVGFFLQMKHHTVEKAAVTSAAVLF